MKIAVRIVQILVGLLFIISGLIKANDPLGLSYKMEEFFIVWSEDLKGNNFLTGLFNFLNERNLFLSIAMITLEIVAGLALLLGWRKKLVLYLLLVLIIFFSFLTGYAYYAKYPNGLPRFTNCGCFGDCLLITPLASFIKDLLLLAMIVLLIKGQRFVPAVFSNKIRTIIVIAGLILSLLLQWYVLKYLPLVDCLPLREGNNIAEQRKPPKNAMPSVYETRLVYENLRTKKVRDLSQDEFNDSKIWEDTSWKWKETKTKLIRQGTDIPKLPNFSLTTLSGVDSTEAILNYPDSCILYFVDPEKNKKLFDQELWDQKAKQMPVFVVTTEPSFFKSEQSRNYKVFTADGTAFRTAARANPTIYLLKNGTILNKWSLERIPVSIISNKN